MSTTKILTIVCWVISALVLLGIAIWFITGSVFGGGLSNWNIGFPGTIVGGTENLSGPFEVDGTYTVRIDGLESIKIDWVAGDVTVTPHGGSEIQITESAQRTLRDNEKLSYSVSGSTLEIRFVERGSISNRIPRKHLEVLVPQSLSESLNNLEIGSVSGGVDVSNFEASTFNVSTVSGAVSAANINSPFIKLGSTSGAITARSVRSDKFGVNSISGAVNLSDSFAATLDVSTTSGAVNLSGEFDRVDASTVSGHTTIKSTVVPERMEVSSVSGAVDVYLPDLGEITVSHSAVSGRFSSEVPVRMQNNAPYSFSSVSGSTNIFVLAAR